ncbi:MAG: DUF2332 domain-containing protein [Pseudomonadota bacterium]
MWSAPKGRSDFIINCREQAGWCRDLGSPFTAALCEAFAADAEAGGVVAEIAASVEPPHRRRATALRLAGALHYAALSGQAPELAKWYAKAGENDSFSGLWAACLDHFQANKAHVETFIRSDPQTNETRRSIALLPGFLAIGKRFGSPIHLLELGASAGLNQNLDQFSYSGAGWQIAGDSGVDVSTDWRAPLPEGPFTHVASRAACDLNPIDLSTHEARWRLKAYTWADQPDRLARLDAAIALALEAGTHVEKADAADWLERKLASRPDSGTTVVFHSVFLHYPPTAVRERIMSLIAKAGETATDQAPLAWLCMEPDSVFTKDNPNLGVFRVRLQTWPGGEAQTLGYTDGHVTYFEAASSARS